MNVGWHPSYENFSKKCMASRFDLNGCLGEGSSWSNLCAPTDPRRDPTPQDTRTRYGTFLSVGRLRSPCSLGVVESFELGPRRRASPRLPGYVSRVESPVDPGVRTKGDVGYGVEG